MPPGTLRADRSRLHVFPYQTSMRVVALPSRTVVIEALGDANFNNYAFVADVTCYAALRGDAYGTISPTGTSSSNRCGLIPAETIVWFFKESNYLYLYNDTPVDGYARFWWPV